MSNINQQTRQHDSTNSKIFESKEKKNQQVKVDGETNFRVPRSPRVNKMVSVSQCCQENKFVTIYFNNRGEISNFPILKSSHYEEQSQFNNSQSSRGPFS